MYNMIWIRIEENHIPSLTTKSKGFGCKTYEPKTKLKRVSNQSKLVRILIKI